MVLLFLQSPSGCESKALQEISTVRTRRGPPSKCRRRTSGRSCRRSAAVCNREGRCYNTAGFTPLPLVQGTPPVRTALFAPPCGFIMEFVPKACPCLRHTPRSDRTFSHRAVPWTRRGYHSFSVPRIPHGKPCGQGNGYHPRLDPPPPGAWPEQLTCKVGPHILA